MSPGIEPAPICTATTPPPLYAQYPGDPYRVGVTVDDVAPLRFRGSSGAFMAEVVGYARQAAADFDIDWPVGSTTTWRLPDNWQIYVEVTLRRPTPLFLATDPA